MVLRVISIVVALIAFVTYSSLFVVDERQKRLYCNLDKLLTLKRNLG